MPVVPVQFGPDSDPARSPNVSGMVLTNCFVERSASGKSKYPIYSAPGLEEFSTPAVSGAVRCLVAIGNVMYSVVGEQMFKVLSSGSANSLGTVLGQTTVIAAVNRKAPYQQIAFVTDTEVYILENDVLTLLADPDLPAGVHSCAFMDGYTIYGISDGRFFLSALNNASSINALDFAEAEGSPDNGVRVFVHGRELWYFGERTTEIWANVGAAAFPFQRMQGGFMTVGCLSKHSPAACDNTVFWVSDVGHVVRAEGYVAKRISNHGVERDIQAARNAGNAGLIEAFVWRDGGHEFYQLTSPTWTWIYDAATGLWSKRESYGGGRSIIKQYVNAFNKHIVGDATTNKIYRMTFDAHDEAGSYLVTAVRSQTIDIQPSLILWNSLVLDMEMGVGRGSAAHGAEPKIMLRWSDDGGHTWSAERERPLGAASNFKGRMKFNRLGKSESQGRIFELRCSAPVRRMFIKATAEIEGLAA